MTARISAGSTAALSAPAWIDKWLAACQDLAELERSNPMTDAVIEEIDGRMIRVGDKWLADFASCNYLGFDLEREIIAPSPATSSNGVRIRAGLACSAARSSTSRSRNSSASWSGAEDTLVLPTITLIHMSVIPILAGAGTIYVDSRAHKTIYEGCQFAASRGATLKRFKFEDPDDLERLLKARQLAARLICIDGVNSMTGNAVDLPRSPRSLAGTTRCCTWTTPTGSASSASAPATSSSPYGNRGNSIVRHPGETYDNVVLVDGLVEGVLVTRGVPYLPARAEAAAQDRRSAVSVLGPVAHRIALWRKTHASKTNRAQRQQKKKKTRFAGAQRLDHAPLYRRTSRGRPHGVRRGMHDAPGYLHAVEVRQHQIHERKIWLKLLDQAHRLEPPIGFPQDGDVSVCLQHLAIAIVSHDGTILYEHERRHVSCSLGPFGSFSSCVCLPSARGVRSGS